MSDHQPSAADRLLAGVRPSRLADLAVRLHFNCLTTQEKLALAVLSDAADDAVAALADSVTEDMTRGYRVPVRVVADPEKTLFVLNLHTDGYSHTQMERAAGQIRQAVANGKGCVILPPHTSLDAYEFPGGPPDTAFADGVETLAIRPTRAISVQAGDVAVRVPGGTAYGTEVLLDGEPVTNLTAVRVDVNRDAVPTVTLTRAILPGDSG